MKKEERNLLNADTSEMSLDELKTHRDKLRAIVNRQSFRVEFWAPFALGFAICTLLVQIMFFIKEHI